MQIAAIVQVAVCNAADGKLPPRPVVRRDNELFLDGLPSIEENAENPHRNHLS